MSAERLQMSSDPGEGPSLPQPSELVDGRYRIEGELGRGGMGVVLAAYDEMLDRSVALKVMLPKMTASHEAVERFVNEARSLARIESRHVVRVLDFGSISEPPGSAGLPFMTLELLHGEDLFSVAARAGGLSPSRVVRYALEACAGLAAAHALGIVHRDLKPENLFLAVEPDGTECLKVLDFGIARSHSRRTTAHRQIGVGSPGYMSPEQVEAPDKVDARSDIWALGVVMYELLAHRPAFIGDNPQSLCLQILTAPVIPLSELRPELPPALVYIVERCMERDPSRRFPNVAELAEALTPLDDWAPASDAARIRRQLDAADDETVTSLQLVPNRSLSSADLNLTPVRAVRPAGRHRRMVSLVAAALVFVPVIALLPRVADAPELAPARAWSAYAVTEAKSAWQAARLRAHQLWMKEPGASPPAVEP
jgi:eukaryotic-like serine/threonine-protein kinase